MHNKPTVAQTKTTAPKDTAGAPNRPPGPPNKPPGPPVKPTPPLVIPLTTEEQVTLHLKLANPEGQPALTETQPVWKVVFGDITLHPSADGTSCTVNTKTACDAQVSVSVTANWGEGNKTVSDTFMVKVTDPHAGKITVDADKPISAQARAERSKDIAGLGLTAEKPEKQPIQPEPVSPPPASPAPEVKPPGQP